MNLVITFSTSHFGFFQHMRDVLPHATFIGFTGTPLEGTDKDTQVVFGDY